MSYYIHHVQGRLRVKSPFIKRSSSAAQEIKRLLGQIRGIESTEINTVTGSAVIFYEPKAVSSQEILETLEIAGYFDLWLMLGSFIFLLATDIFDGLVARRKGQQNGVRGAVMDAVADKCFILPLIFPFWGYKIICCKTPYWAN